ADQPEYGSTVARAGASMGEHAFAAAWADGHDMAPDVAVAKTLQAVAQDRPGSGPRRRRNEAKAIGAAQRGCRTQTTDVVRRATWCESDCLRAHESLPAAGPRSRNQPDRPGPAHHRAPTGRAGLDNSARQGRLP